MNLQKFFFQKMNFLCFFLANSSTFNTKWVWKALLSITSAKINSDESVEMNHGIDDALVEFEVQLKAKVSKSFKVKLLKVIWCVPLLFVLSIVSVSTEVNDFSSSHRFKVSTIFQSQIIIRKSRIEILIEILALHHNQQFNYRKTHNDQLHSCPHHKLCLEFLTISEQLQEVSADLKFFRSGLRC